MPGGLTSQWGAGWTAVRYPDGHVYQTRTMPRQVLDRRGIVLTRDQLLAQYPAAFAAAMSARMLPCS